MLNEFEDDIEFMMIPHISVVDIREGEMGAKQWKMSFRSFIEGWFSDFIVTDKKSDVPIFIPGSFKPENQWESKEPEPGSNNQVSYRLWQNMDKVYLLCLDFDGNETRNGKNLLDNAKDVFKNHEYFVHSTHSRTKQSPNKYRMILKLEHPISIDEWTPFVKKVIGALGADKACSNPSRVFFVPSSIDPDNPENEKIYLEPYSEYNEGNAVTVDFVENLANEYQNDLRRKGKTEELKEYVSQISNKPVIEGKRHPAGGLVTNNTIYSKVDTSYDAYVDRHMERIQRFLYADNRHDFALRSIMSEFATFKDLVDINTLVMFLYKAAEEYGDTYMYMEGSPSEDRKVYKTAEEISRLKSQRRLRNTPRELYEMVHSAAMSVNLASKSAEYFTSKLDAAIRAAEHASQTNNWIFRKPKPLSVKKNNEKTDPFDECLEKNKEVIEQFYIEKDWNSFVKNVLSMASDKEDAYYRSQVIMKVIDDFYRDVVGRKIESEPFHNELARISKEFGKNDKYFKNSILSGFLSYKDKMSQLDQKSSKPPHP